MNHPDPSRLLETILAGEGDSPDLARHLQACAACRAEAGRLREEAADLGAELPIGPGPECLAPPALAAFIDGTLGQPERSAAVEHVATCSHCRAELADLMDLLEAPEVRREREPARAPGSRRLLRVGSAIAAAAVLVIIATRAFAPDGESNHRSSTSPQALTPVVLGPVGEVAAVESLAWRAIPGSDWYRVTVFDAHGAVVLEQEGPDTLLVVPDSIRFEAGQTYLWRVEARIGWDRWVGTSLLRFSVGSPRQ